MTPYIGKHKLKWSFNYTSQLRKRKLMTLALLTGITDSSNIIAGINRELMNMKDMTNYGSRRMTEVRVPLR
jgi:hypothetical protein